MEVVAADIGGTHARFAIAEIAGGRVVALSDAVTLATAEHAGLAAAWSAFAGRLGRPLPRTAAIAVAAPIEGAVIALTNGCWTVRPGSLDRELGLECSLLVNDFAAVAHAVAQAGPDDLLHVCGPERPLPECGIVTVCGPGTGLGVAQLLRTADGDRVVATEGGHIGYAPFDAFEDRLLATLRSQHGRVSAERVAAGPGIAAIYRTLTASAGAAPALRDDRAIWHAALAGADPLAVAALDRFCAVLGSVVGDLALAHGADAVVLAGGLGFRLRNHLPGSGFGARFVAKGRFEQRIRALPVKMLTMPEPGLFGAAAALAATSRRAGA